MFSTNPAKQYPYLFGYLQTRLRETQTDFSHHPAFAAIMLCVGLGLMLGGLSLLGSSIIGGLLFTLTGVAVGAGASYFAARLIRRRRDAIPTAREIESRAAANSLSRMMVARRIHRDLDPNTLELLEDACRSWSRVHIAMGRESWRNVNLPAAYAIVREQATRAANEGMSDILLLYRPFLPDNVASRPEMDYVDEALEKFVMKPKPAAEAPPVYFEARSVADKLHTLARESERIGAENVFAQDAVPGRSVEIALADIRQIRDAEDELRNDLKA